MFTHLHLKGVIFVFGIGLTVYLYINRFVYMHVCVYFYMFCFVEASVFYKENGMRKKKVPICKVLLRFSVTYSKGYTDILIDVKQKCGHFFVSLMVLPFDCNSFVFSFLAIPMTELKRHWEQEY